MRYKFLKKGTILKNEKNIFFIVSDRFYDKDGVLTIRIDKVII